MKGQLSNKANIKPKTITHVLKKKRERTKIKASIENNPVNCSLNITTMDNMGTIMLTPLLYTLQLPSNNKVFYIDSYRHNEYFLGWNLPI